MADNRMVTGKAGKISAGNLSYEEALEYIHGTLKFGSKLGLRNIGILLELMGNPHKKLKYVHVAGTNGKGSTVAFISRILMEAGLKTGIFTSPYIQRFTERMKVDGDEVGHEELARLTGFVRSKVDQMLEMGESHPTEFEIVTAIAFQFFMERGCDIVVLEVGLGGRFDSTNIIDAPELAVITTISLDHTDILGDTLEKIACEKAGIIKQGTAVLAFPQPPEVEEVIRRVCLEKGAELTIADFSGLRLISHDISGQRFDYEQYKGLEIALLGAHQLKNAILAVRAAELLAGKGNISDIASVINIIDVASILRRGLKNARWPGRLEVLSNDRSRIDTPATFIIDGAHNIEGAMALKNTLDEYFPKKRLTLIIGVLGDKDYKGMIETVVPGSSRVITVTPDSPRALPAERLAVEIRPYCNDVLISDTIEEAIKLSICNASEEDVICAFGSLYYIGGIREIFGL